MKALRTTLAAVIFLIGTMTTNAQSMTIAVMRDHARFLTDRMAYSLGVRDPFIIDEIYRINYDYLWGVNDYIDEVALGYYHDEYDLVLAARDAALRNLLGATLWSRLSAIHYFLRPITFAGNAWRIHIYDYDRYGRNRFYYSTPRPLAHYSGGHFIHRMAPAQPARALGAGPRIGQDTRPGGASLRVSRGGNVTLTRPGATPAHLSTPQTRPNMNVNRNNVNVPHTNTPQTRQNMNVNRDNVSVPHTNTPQTRPNMNVNRNNVSVPQPNTPQARPNSPRQLEGGYSPAHGMTRSAGNINSSSRQNIGRGSMGTPSVSTHAGRTTYSGGMRGTSPHTGQSSRPGGARR